MTLIEEMIIFCEKETQNIITQLQAFRFENDGAFNGHEEWSYNSQKVIDGKGFDKPLYDTGELAHELQTASNWDLKPQIVGNTLVLTVPDREDFTNSKYDILDTGGDVNTSYIGRKNGKKIFIEWVPARPFKDLSIKDIEWITDRLVEAIKRKFA